MLPYACAYACMTNEKTKANSLENITWSELGKKKLEATKVY